MRINQFLMGTLITIEVKKASEPVISKALAEINRIERLMSRFLLASDIAHLNAANQQPVTVSEETFRVIEEALLFSQISGGVFDITTNSHNGGDYRDICLDRDTFQVSLKKPNMSVDLGAIAKGYAVDKAIEAISNSGVKDALVNAGGEVRVLGNSYSEKRWTVGIQHPRVQDSLLCCLPLANRAVATSGDYYRYDFNRGYRHHHILDPRRGEPATGSATAVVVADEAIVADALATAAFVLGPDDGVQLLENLPGVEGLVVNPKGQTSITSGLKVIWDADYSTKIREYSTNTRSHRSYGLLVSGLILFNALTFGCQGEVDAPTPVICPTPTENNDIVIILQDGTYQGRSISGVLVEVEVTVQGGNIHNIEILEYKEISSIFAGLPTEIEKESWQTTKSEILKTIPEQILEKQSTHVDTVTGATMSSKTIIAAVEDALTKAVLDNTR
ncbi:FAD:protein FMN transferase [Bacteroidota bacterium]